MAQRRDKLGRFSAARSRKKSSRVAKPIAESFPTYRDFGVGPTHDTISFQRLLELNVWVQASVTRLAMATASVPFRVIKSGTDEDAESRQADEIRELVNRVNPDESSFDFREQCVIHLATDGEMVVEKARGLGGRGPTAEFYCLNPTFMKAVPDRTGRRRISHWLYEPRGFGGPSVRIAAEDIIHCRYYNPLNPFRGLSPLAAIRAEIAGDIAAARYNTSLIEKGMRPGGILSPTDGDLDDDSWRRLKAAVEEQVRGANNAGKLLALPSGFKFDRDNITPREMDFLGSRKFTRECAAAAHGVAPMMIQNFDSATYANSEQQLKAFWDYTGVPLLLKMFGAFNEHWVHVEYGPELSLAPDLVAIATLVDSEKTRVANSQMKLNGGLITINEARAEIGYKAVPDGDKFLIQGALVPMAPDAITNPLSDGLGIPDEMPAADAPAETEELVADPNELETVEEFVLNGAQIQAAITIVTAVAAGEIPRDSGMGSLQIMFNLTPEQAEQVMGSAGKEDVPTTPNPKPQQAQEQQGQQSGQEQDGNEDAPPAEEGAQPNANGDEGSALAERRALMFGRNGTNGHYKPKGPTQDERDAIKRLHAKGLADARRRVRSAAKGALAGLLRRVQARLRKAGPTAQATDLIPNVQAEATALLNDIAPALLAVMRESGEATLRRLGFAREQRSWRARAPHLKQGTAAISFALDNPAIRNYFNNHLFKHLYRVSQHALDQLGKVIEQHRASQAAGEGVSELAARLVDMPIFGGKRAEVIAHTETLAAIGTASYEAFQAAETPRKSWLSTGRRTRYSHAAAEVETSANPIPTDQPFVLSEPGRGVAECRFPGDPLAPGWAAINCACTLVPEAAADDERATAFARHYARKCVEELRATVTA